MSRTFLFASALSVSLAMGCQTTPAGPAAEHSAHAAKSEAMHALTGDWMAIWLDGQDLESVDRPPVLNIAADGKIGGFAGVNRYFAVLDIGDLDAGAFRVGAIGATKMAGPPDRMDLELRFTRALSESTRYSVRDGELSLSAGPTDRIRFVKAMAR